MSQKSDPPNHSPLQKRVLELEQSLEEAILKYEEAESAKLRALADLQNQKRRATEQQAQWGDIAVSSFLKSFLPRFFELQLGAEHSKDADLKKVIEQFFQSLSQSGLQKIEPKAGESLDPHIHEVMMQAEGTPGKIVSTLEPGWQYKETIILPAKVSAAMQS